MSIVVAHQKSATWQLTLQEAAKEAQLRQAPLVVVHVAEGVDIEVNGEQQTRLKEEIASELQRTDLHPTSWDLRMLTGEDVAETVLDAVAQSDAQLLVIGARRRSPVGKLIMGSATQTIILRADLPVMVVKAPAGR